MPSAKKSAPSLSKLKTKIDSKPASYRRRRFIGNDPSQPDRAEYHIVPEPEVMDVRSLDTGVEVVFNKPAKLTQQRAREFFDLPRFEGESPYNEFHISFLASQMKQGNFRSEGVEIITCVVAKKGQSLEGLKRYRINGKHTCSAKLSMPDSYEPMVRFVEYRAENEDYMRVLYSTIDNGQNRTMSNQLIALLGGTADFKHIQNDRIRRIGEGMAFWRWEGPHERGKHGANDRAALLQGEMKSLALHVNDILKGGTNAQVSHLNRAPVIGAMFATMQKSLHGERGAKAFWTAVRDGSGMKSGDPRLVLRDALRESSMSGYSVGKRRKVQTREGMFLQCIYGWNAFREGRDVRNLHMSRGGAKGRPKLL